MQPAPHQPTRVPAWAVLPASACFTQITSSFVLAQLFIVSKCFETDVSFIESGLVLKPLNYFSVGSAILQ